VVKKGYSYEHTDAASKLILSPHIPKVLPTTTTRATCNPARPRVIMMKHESIFSKRNNGGEGDERVLGNFGLSGGPGQPGPKCDEAELVSG